VDGGPDSWTPACYGPEDGEGLEGTERLRMINEWDKGDGRGIEIEKWGE
jgi:hypothetical protein